VFPVLQAYMLADRGHLSLDDTLADLGGNKVTFVNPYGSQQQPTLRELASQRAALPREAPCDRPLLCNLTDAQVVARINLTTALIQEPGGTPSYSNLAFALLGRELTSVAASPLLVDDSSAAASDPLTWEQWTQRNILDPLKLSGTGFGLDLAPGANPAAAVGCNPDGTQVGTYHLGWNAPCGGMRSSARDLSTLASVLMDGAKPLLVSRALAQELLDPVFVDHAGGTLFGTPWEMQFHNSTGMLVRRKGGNVPGYSALMAFVPEMHISLSMLWAGATDEFSASMAAFDTVLPPMLAWLQGAEAVQPQPNNAAAFLGNWTIKGGDPAVPSNAAQIFQHQGMLLVKINLLGVGMYVREPPAQWAHGNSTVLQLWVPRTVAPCLTLELQALINQYLVFDATLASFTLEGYVPGYVWERVQHIQ
jgi:CubicO group peptidase (beta-lactamase class C family)